MKKIIIYFFSAVILLGITSCKDEDKYLFGEGPDERLRKHLTAYQDLLCNAPNGWMVMVGTQNTGVNGGTYRLFMQFTQDNRVTMYSDRDTIQAITPKTSSYRLKAMQFPTLMFDTYNYLHDLANPLPEVSGGTKGVGLLSDFDFNLMNEPTGDEIVAIGRKNNCPIIMRKATAAEEAAITGGEKMLVDIQTTMTNNVMPIKFATIDIDGNYILLSIGKRQTLFTYKDTEGVVSAHNTSSYAEFNQDILLMEPFEYGGITFDRLVWDGTKYAVTVNGTSYPVYDHGGSPLPFEFGVGKTYTLLTVNKSQLNTTEGNSMVDPFLSVYNAANNGILNSPGYTGRFPLEYFTIKFGANSTSKTMTLSVKCVGVAYMPTYVYTLHEDPDGTVYFTNFQSQRNAYNNYTNIFGAGIYNNLLSYFLYDGAGMLEIIDRENLIVNPSGNKFKLNWVDNNTPGLAGALGGLILVSDEANYVPGVPGR